MAREGGWGGLTTPWHGQAWAAPPGGVAASQSLSVSSSGEIGFLQYFPRYLLKVGFLHKKRDTRVILLKTALVCVSCIQNTQIRGETTAKVFGKVDMFWTYQAPLVHFLTSPLRLYILLSEKTLRG
jgi:hypothetical protein